MKFFAAFAALVSFVSADPKCCSVCPAGEVKTYSIVPSAGHCGISCIHADKFFLYHIFEHGLKQASSTTGNPCAENGYGSYWHTIDGGIPHVLEVQVDFYNKTSAAAPALQNLILL